MVLSAHDLWSHISRSAGGVLGIVWIPHTGDTEVGSAEIALLIEYEVLRFDVSMECAVSMEILKSQNDASDEEFCHQTNSLVCS